jgi:hypothetical protein
MTDPVERLVPKTHLSALGLPAAVGSSAVASDEFLACPFKDF